MTDFKQQLEDRVNDRFLHMGMPTKAARRCAADATASYLAEEGGIHFDLVQVEAVKIFVSVISDASSSMLQAWAGASQVMSAALGIIVKASAPPTSDFISGYPDHYLVNGHTDSCGCDTHRFGHSASCSVWDDPSFEHKPTICDITRTQCDHRPRHTYGQHCSDYLPPLRSVSEAFADASQQAVVGFVIGISQGHGPSCVSQGGHASGDCDKPRATCQHTPRHLYGESCPR